MVSTEDFDSSSGSSSLSGATKYNKMIKILRKEGFILNPNDKVVNSLLKNIERNNGECICAGNVSTDKHCPCSDYREKSHCCCNLYIKDGR